MLRTRKVLVAIDFHCVEKNKCCGSQCGPAMFGKILNFWVIPLNNYYTVTVINLLSDTNGNILHLENNSGRKYNDLSQRFITLFNDTSLHYETL